MFTFRCHRTYINDLKPYARSVCKIDEVQALELLGRSPYVKRDPETRHTQGTLLNKGYCLVDVRHGCAFFVYNHDGKYWLYTAEAEPALKELGLTLAPER